MLADFIEGNRLHREEGCDELPVREALWQFDSMERRPSWQIRHFVAEARLPRLFLRDVDDRQLLDIIRQAIRAGHLIALRKGAGAADATSETVERRRLVRQIEQQTRGRMGYAGRQYKLVVDVDLAGTPGRDSYEVVSRNDAHRVLDGLAKQSGPAGDLAGLLVQASAKLTPDWRPPFHPDGLILLRRSIVQAATKPDDGPAITPSQLRELMEKEKPLQFLARFVDERGKPITGFSGDFEHGDDAKTDMVFSGSDFARMGDLKGARQAWLTFPDDANQDVVDVLKKRWKEIRGEADHAWKEKTEKEGPLIEVLFKEGKLPELQLEVEKKHTFMLRPPVALAHLHGMYFDSNKCFLLPTAIASLKRLVEIYALHPDSQVLIVGHTDTAGSEAFNLELSADRAEAMQAYLRDDADTWLAWYDQGVRASKRWGEHEDLSMIDALVPDNEFGKGSHVAAYQKWHNGEAPDARQEGEPRSQPDKWEELKVDGILGAKTRRQLVLDYMNLDGTSLTWEPLEGSQTLPHSGSAGQSPATPTRQDNDVRVVSYGCGEYFPLESEDGEVDAKGGNDADDGEDVPFDRRVEVFFFAKPFGILPPVPSVAEGESSKQATKAGQGDKLYPEWRRRATHHYTIEVEGDGFRMRLCNDGSQPYAERPFAFCLEGYPEIRGTTDKEGFVIIDSPPSGAQGYVEVWPDDDQPDDKVRWDVEIASIISPQTPQGAATRLTNLNYFASEPTDEMTDELREAIGYFQGESDGLEVTGELDGETASRLCDLHDCQDAEAGPSPAAAGPAT